MENRVLHVFGDSHASSGWRKLDQSQRKIFTHHLGPFLCYSFGQRGLGLLDIAQFGVQEGDAVVFCFGEIDCRCHVKKHVTKEKTPHLVIQDIVSGYIKAILENTKRFPRLQVCVYNVPPPVQRSHTAENPTFPFCGTDEERKVYAECFNDQLREQCKKAGFCFIDVYDKYADVNGFLNRKYSDGHVHIDDCCFLETFLQAHQIAL